MHKKLLLSFLCIYFYSNQISTQSTTDLVITNTVNDLTPSEGDTILYTIIVSNNGPEQATNTRIDDTLPFGITATNVNILSQGNYNGTTWEIGTIDSGSNATLTIEATVDVGTSDDIITNTVTNVMLDQTDSNLTADDLTENIIIENESDLVITKTVDNFAPFAGNIIAYTITLLNNGPAQITNLTLDDILPTVVTASGLNIASQGNYDGTTWVVGTINNGNGATLTIEAFVDFGAEGSFITNVITNIFSDQIDNDFTPDDLSETIQVKAILDSDGDGIPDSADLDDDNDGIPDSIESPTLDYDIDADGVPNRLDLDSDNDGIYDVVESGQLNGFSVVDTNNDGIIDGFLVDFGTNGLFNNIETDDTITATVTNPTADADNDIIPDSNELDADNDSCYDVLEAGFTDSDMDGLLGIGFLTVDVNGVVTSSIDGYTTPLDANINAIYDFQEVGVSPIISAQPLDQATVINANANFYVLSTASIYQWQESADDGVSWFNLSNGGANPSYSGATTDNLTLSFVPVSHNEYRYRIVLSSLGYACGGFIVSNSTLLSVNSDFDGDSIADTIDLDDDNDGIPDIIEYNGFDPLADTDADGIPAYLDDDDNNQLIGNVDGLVEAPFDLDADGIANHFDIDSDEDDIYDVNEAGHFAIDANDDGMIDGSASNSGANGLFDALETSPNSGLINYVLVDTDDDLNANFLDTDDDGDSILTIDEGSNADTDGDSILDYLDVDDDNDGIKTLTEGIQNIDADSLPSYKDLDSDNDGVPDNVEAQTTLGYILPTGSDSNANGLDDAYEPNGITPIDTDVDAIPDYLDIDSDNDGVFDNTEGYDYNADGQPDISRSFNDADADGLDDAYDSSLTDYNDPNGLAITSDPLNDLPNRDSSLSSNESDYRDNDDDGDGILTFVEDADNDTDPTNDDTDNDGTPDYLDNNVLSTDNYDSNLFSIYPNPTKGVVYLELNNNQSDIEISIFTVTGQKVYNEIKDKNEEVKINFSSFTKGIYFIKVTSDNSFSYKKIIRE